MFKIVNQVLEAIAFVYESPSCRDECEECVLSGTISSARTGFVVGGRYVLTTLHGIEGPCVCIIIDGEVLPVSRIYRDPKWDIAVLDLGRPIDRESLAIASRNPLLGEIVFVVGMNRGQLSPYVQMSIVSGLGLSIKVGSRIIEGVFQICNAVPRGLSGAPVVSIHGEVLGMVIGIDYEMGHTFAVPQFMLNSALNYAMKGVDPSSRPRLGIKVLSQHGNLLILKTLENDRPCDLMPGDRLTECFDGSKWVRLTTLYDLWRCLDSAFLNGKKFIELKVLRNRKVEFIKCAIR